MTQSPLAEGLGLLPAQRLPLPASTPGQGSRCPHLRREWAHPACTWNATVLEPVTHPCWDKATFTRTHTRTHSNARKHASSHSLGTHARTHARMHARTHAHTHTSTTHTHTQTHTRKHTHKHKHTCLRLFWFASRLSGVLRTDDAAATAAAAHMRAHWRAAATGGSTALRVGAQRHPLQRSATCCSAAQSVAALAPPVASRRGHG